MTTAKANPRPLRVLITGASSFIGSCLVEKLAASKQYSIRCMTRHIDSLKKRFDPDVELVYGDAGNYYDLVEALSGVDVAFYFIHSMEESATGHAKFAEKDKILAENFSRAATECHVDRIIYLEERSPDGSSEK
jgi:nucleoside-diphosphate-sugar epimerase